jgi:hypothetical protein
MSGAKHPLPQYAFMARCSVKKSTEKTLPSTFLQLHNVFFSPNIVWGEDETSWAYNTHEEIKNSYKSVVGKSQRKSLL